MGRPLRGAVSARLVPSAIEGVSACVYVTPMPLPEPAADGGGVPQSAADPGEAPE
jgi:hypothetical protein